MPSVAPTGRRFGVSAATITLAMLIAGNVTATSLPEAVSTSLRSHPQLAATAAEERASREDVTAARAGYYPSLDMVGRIGHERSSIKQLRANGSDARELGRREFGITASQMLFDGFATQGEVERRMALLSAAGSRTADVRESVAFAAAQAFFDVMKNRGLVSLARANVAAHQETLRKVSRRAERGIGRKADVDQGRSRLALAQSTLVAREGTLRESVANYQRVIGEAPGELRAPNPHDLGLAADGSVNATRLGEMVAEITAAATSAHPALKSAQAEVEAAAAAIRVARSGYWPSLDLEAGITRDDNVAGVAGERNTNSLMLVSRWNLFRGGADEAREMASAERHSAAKDNAADTRRIIEQNVAIAVQAKATSEARLSFLRDYVAATQATLDSYRSQFELGRRTLLDTLNAENELFNARSALLSTEYDDLLNYYFIEASKGSLVSALGLSVE